MDNRRQQIFIQSDAYIVQGRAKMCENVVNAPETT
jgi:hypothetical protein